MTYLSYHSQALQVACGLFPIPQLSEPYSAVQYIAERLPLEQIYGLTRVKNEDTNTVVEVLGEDDPFAMLQKNNIKKKGKGKEKNDDGMRCSMLGRDMTFIMCMMMPCAQAFMYVMVFAIMYHNPLDRPWSAWDICEAYAQLKNYHVQGSNGRLGM